MTKAALISERDGAVIQRFTLGERAIRVATPDGETVSPAYVGWVSPDKAYRIVEVIEVGFNSPGEYYTEAGIEEVRDGDTLTRTKTWVEWSAQEIADHEEAQAEKRASRLDNAEDIFVAVALVFNDRINAIFSAANQASNLADFKSRMNTIAQAGGSMTASELRAEVKRRVKG